MKTFITLCKSALIMLVLFNTTLSAQTDQDFTSYWQKFKDALNNENTAALNKMIWDNVVVIEGESDSYTFISKNDFINSDESILYEYFDELVQLNPANFKKSTINDRAYIITGGSGSEEEYESEEGYEEEPEEIEEPEGYEENEETGAEEAEGINLAEDFAGNATVYYAEVQFDDDEGTHYTLSFDFVKHNGTYYLFYVSILF